MGTNSITEFKKKVSKSYEIITASYHESGHAICALLKFIMVDRIEVNLTTKSKQIEGLTLYYSHLDKFNNSKIVNFYQHSEVCVNYSGLIAEKIFYKRISGSDKFPSFLKDGSSSDTQTAAKIIEKYSFVPAGESRLLYKKKITKQLYILLETYWSDIELLSHYLFQKKRINYSQIKFLLTRKSENKEFWKSQFKDIEKLYSDSTSLDENKIKIILDL